jgi:hypothetical protein
MFLNPGERTFGVLTKIDLMDKGTDAVGVSSYCICYSYCTKVLKQLITLLNGQVTLTLYFKYVPANVTESNNSKLPMS